MSKTKKAERIEKAEVPGGNPPSQAVLFEESLKETDLRYAWTHIPCASWTAPPADTAGE